MGGYMEIRRLNYFVRIAEDGSLTRAAEFLRIAQPALSRQPLQVAIAQQTEVARVAVSRGIAPEQAFRDLLTVLHLCRIVGKVLSRKRQGCPCIVEASCLVTLAQLRQSKGQPVIDPGWNGALAG